MEKKIYAIDFDGTLCEDAFPRIGAERKEILDFVKDKKEKGHYIILWTCRVGERLREAVKWCSEHGIEFDAINENLPFIIDMYGSDTRKITADYYVDDKAVMAKF